MSASGSKTDPTILQRNLLALAFHSPVTAGLIQSAAAADDVEFLQTEDGVPTVIRRRGEESRQLASRVRPLAEGAALAGTIDLEKTAAVVVMGFGVGWHVRAMQERLKNTGIVIVFEPDVRLLRAVLERIDHSGWLINARVLTRADDTGAIAAAVGGAEALLALGTRLIQHPPSIRPLGDQADRFAASFTTVMKAVRTSIVTTLMQVETTLRNVLQNVDHYVTVPGVKGLAGRFRGRPAVVVAAGPSLERNLHHLSRPGVRDRVVIIAVQTVLKTMLSRGIRPHYVTALDYHEISRRFYEGLSEEDLKGITLVAEPKANPAILSAFRGRIRCPADGVLDTLLGPDLARDMGAMPPGATVAHLAYYLARHMGCDPVMLIGQDLGFTDGQYYAAGAAIHEVWSGELSEFNTLEMLEWQRIARMKSLLRRTTDVLGRTIYTDEQMSTYLVQFERDFASDAALGHTTIDATEGGVAKKHTIPMPLAEALAAFCGKAAPADLSDTQEPGGGADRIERARERLSAIKADVWRLGECSRRTIELLESIREEQDNQPKVNRLLSEVYGIRDAVMGMKTAHWLVQYLNQTGTLNRFRADRLIAIEAGLSDIERQRRQIERDIVNVRWIAESADLAGAMLYDAVQSLRGRAKITRDMSAPSAESDAPDRANTPRKRVVAVITVDPHFSGLGTQRDLEREFICGKSPLEMTLLRLARCVELDGIVLASLEDGAARRAAETVARDGAGGRGLRLVDSVHEMTSTGGSCEPIPVLVREVDAELVRDRAASVGAARLWSRHCWRGGLADISCYDEAICPAAILPLMEEIGIDAAMIVGADWALIDPELADAAAERYREAPDRHRMTFCHAPPGLGACVIDRQIVAELAGSPGPFSTIGGLLGYIPVAPQSDPIAKPACIKPDPVVRDLGWRCIPDSVENARVLRDSLAKLGRAVLYASATEVAVAIRGREAIWLSRQPDTAEIDLFPCGREISSDAFTTLVADAASREDRAVALRGDDARDALDHPSLPAFVMLLRGAGVAAVHVRTSLRADPDRVEALLGARPDVISVDCVADNRETYRALSGRDGFEQMRANLDLLLAIREPDDVIGKGGLPHVWIVPRITRRDAVHEEIENFYDRELMRCGACVIDPPPGSARTERISPLPVPPRVGARIARSSVRLSPPGTARSMIETREAVAAPDAREVAG